jgi:SpoIID/LytB domain protein
MAIDIDKFVHDQLSVWPAVAAKYRALKSARTRTLKIDGMLVTLQSNPGRVPIFDHGCPLCEENYMEHQHTLPFEGRKGRKYNILVNRAPIFPNHLVITRDTHVPQTIWHRFPDMLDLSCAFQDYMVFYNSPNSGTTVPQHAHFQACPKGYMPLERTADRLLRAISANGGNLPEELKTDLEFLDSVKDAQLYHYKHFTRGVFMLRAKTSKSMAKMFYRLLDCETLVAEETEPRFNAFTWIGEGEYRAFVTIRRQEKPHHYFAEGDENFAISPGAADMGGFVVVPQEKDFERITPEILSQIYSEVSISEDEEKHLLWRLVRTQPKIEVGIMAAPEITFEIISDGAGPQKVSYREGKIDYNGVLYDSLVFEAPTISTLFAEPSFILHGVTIGVGFHWQRQQEQKFAGTLKFIVDAPYVRAVNIIGIEDYLLSVISSEMSAQSSLELLKAHAVISRSWVMSMIEKRRNTHKASGPALTGTPGLVTWLEGRMPEQSDSKDADTIEIRKWFDHQDHKNFDVCADDHCQRYQGLTMAVGNNVREAIDQTWGQVLRYNGELADARFHKCCGGRTERFSSAWEDKDYPYLPVKEDPWCDTKDRAVLEKVLNGYDLETTGFHDWEVRYDIDELSALISERSGVDIGRLTGLEPLERGGSGRITRLKVIGTKKTLILGKELIIRKYLSTSHLYSSWFDAEFTGDEVVLHGHGWGHGVGLCQIGAAVMASKGHGYREILQFYYPGTEL